MRAGVQGTQRVPEQTITALEACRWRTILPIPCDHGVCDLRGPRKGRRQSPMVGILHQQVTYQCRNEIYRNGKTGPSPCDRYKKIETVFPFTPSSGPHQLPAEVGPPKVGCFRPTTEVGNQAKSVRDQVPNSASRKGTSSSGLHRRILP